MEIYQSLNYKEFITARLARGEQKRFAEHLNCQPAFLSQVLRGKPHLSLEQGISASEYLRLNKLESEYFMELLQYCRAGTARLREYFGSKLEEQKAISRKIEAKIGLFDEIDVVTKAQFYSSWKYALVHVLLAVPQEDQIEHVQKRTGLSIIEIKKVISFLIRVGLISKKGSDYYPTKKRIHLNRDDVQIAEHHKNFRTLSIRNLEDLKTEAFHYSAAISLSKTDAEKIRALLLETIEKSENILRPSDEETTRVLNIDFFLPG